MKNAMVTLFIFAVLISVAACGGQSKAVSVDLSDFYDEIAEEYELPEMMEMSDGLLESYYPGLKEVSLKQSIIKIPKLTSTVSEYVFVECEDKADVSAVEDILKARIDEQASGGAWYPATVAAWGQALVVANGNYVAMVSAGDDTGSIVSEWNALFG